jgi:hypothetical protein
MEHEQTVFHSKGEAHMKGWEDLAKEKVGELNPQNELLQGIKEEMARVSDGGSLHPEIGNLGAKDMYEPGKEEEKVQAPISDQSIDPLVWKLDKIGDNLIKEGNQLIKDAGGQELNQSDQDEGLLDKAWDTADCLLQETIEKFKGLRTSEIDACSSKLNALGDNLIDEGNQIIKDAGGQEMGLSDQDPSLVDKASKKEENANSQDQEQHKGGITGFIQTVKSEISDAIHYVKNTISGE